MINKHILLSIIVISFILNLGLACYASDIQFEVTVERNRLVLGESLQLNLTFHGTQNIPAPQLGNIDGFDVRYLGPSTRVSIVNGVVSSSITHIYSLIPLKTGIFNIGPFSLQIQGKTFTSKPITIEVVSASTQSGYPAQRQPDTYNQGLIDTEQLKDRIFLILNVDKRRMYLNEVVPFSIKLYVNRLGVRDIQFPLLETENFSIEKFTQPRQYREELGGILYDVIEFNSQLFAIKPGEFTLGPAKLNCNLVLRRQSSRRRSIFDEDFFSSFFDEDIFEDFFARYQAYPLELVSPAITITVLDLPKEGRPLDFEGAVGNFRLEVEALPLEVKVGDPITVKMKIKGEGNFDSVKAPKLESADGFKVYEPQFKQNESEKIFEQVIIPQSEKITHIPQIRFSFFNPQIAKYQTLVNPAIPITVTAATESEQKLIELPKVLIRPPEKEELGKDIIYIKNSPGKFRRIGEYLYQSVIFWTIQTLSFIVFIVVLALYLQKQRLISDERYARRIQASSKAKAGLQELNRLLKSANTEIFFDKAFKLFREYLADRFNITPGGITAISIEEIAREKGLPHDIIEKINKVFVSCDMARYAPLQFDQRQAEEVFSNLKEVIEYLQKQKI